MATMHVLFRCGLVLTGLVLLTTVTGCAARFGGPSQIPCSEASQYGVRRRPQHPFRTIVHPLVAAHPGQSGFYLLNNGIEALAARLLLEQSRAQY